MTRTCRVKNQLPLIGLSGVVGVAVAICGAAAYRRLKEKQHATNVRLREISRMGQNDSTDDGDNSHSTHNKEMWKKKKCFFPIATHIIDQATDIAIILQFAQLYFNSNSDSDT